MDWRGREREGEGGNNQGGEVLFCWEGGEGCRISAVVSDKICNTSTLGLALGEFVLHKTSRIQSCKKHLPPLLLTPSIRARTG